MTLALSSGASAQTPIVFESQQLLASDGSSGQAFGVSTAIDGDVAVVGASFDDQKGTNAGAAYVYRFDGTQWVEDQKLLASDGAAADGFGAAVSISGNVAVVGSPYNNGTNFKSGAAYVYRYDGASWIQEQKLLAFDGGGILDGFGESVGISGDAIVVGARSNDAVALNAGAAYVYRDLGAGWAPEQKLIAPDGAASDFFGAALAISGDVIVVGVRGDDDFGPNTGSAWVFGHDGAAWLAEQKLLASDAGLLDNFGGDSISVSGDVILIGARGDDDNGSSAGAAYVYRDDGASWVEEQKLLASDGAADDWFGAAVSVSGDTAVIGAYYNDDIGFNTGAAYAFEYDGATWVEESKLLASDAAGNDWLGGAVAVSGSVALAGARLSDANGSNSGAAYVFDLLLEVEIDIKPGSDPNVFNLNSAVVPVAILGSEAFDVLDVDLTTLAFGPNGATAAHDPGGHYEDVNLDGEMDLVVHFITKDTGFNFAATEGCVTGETLDATPFQGCDAVIVVPACGIGFELALLLPPLMWLRRRRRSTH